MLLIAVIISIVGISIVIVSPVVDGAKQLCSDDKTGVYVGLAIDEDAYTSVPGSKNDENDVAQSWTIVTEQGHADDDDGGPQHSYDGRYLQVLPDSGRTYPSNNNNGNNNSSGHNNHGGGGGGHHLKDPNDLDGDSPYVAFEFRVSKKSEGVHTLFVRWTGGDTVGGGDSFFVVLYKLKSSSSKNNNNKELIHGQQTVKPAVVPIDSGMSKFDGCCYDMTTHACPCYTSRPSSSSSNNATSPSCPTYVEREKASKFGIQCLVGGGAMVIIKEPAWYLFAGQEAGDVMDFDSEPWDVTCEADGSNTKDSGHDFPSWVLHHGTYQLRLYAREDGTALDGIYIAGPTGEAPVVSKRYSKGDSTYCEERSLFSSPWFVSSVGIIVVLISFCGYIHRTDRGKQILNSILSSSPAEAVRYVYIETT